MSNTSISHPTPLELAALRTVDDLYEVSQRISLLSVLFGSSTDAVVPSGQLVAATLTSLEKDLTQIRDALDRVRQGSSDASEEQRA